jgi:hypothetical protein
MAWFSWEPFQLLPEFEDQVVNGTRSGIAVISPHFVQEFCSTQHALGVIQEIL